MDYALLKWLHILSSTLLFGTGLGSAYYMFFASRGGDPRTVAAVVRLVVRADWWFTATTAVFQPLSGLWLAHMAGLPLGSSWIALSLALYALAIACWLPVVRMQIRMRDLAAAAAARGEALPADYRQLLRIWVALGAVAFLSLLAVFWLMVAKPG